MRNSILYYLRTLCLFLLLSFTSPAAFAQTNSVSGTVRDAAGEPLIGARVGIDGSTAGVIADAAGEFIVQVAPQGRLIVSYLGFVTQAIDVAGRDHIDVIMEVDSQTLQEVVVIGYGTQRREAVTGSVASMRGDVVREVPGGNITQALAGRIAGVQMTQSNSKPGASMQIRIRGERSLSATNDPLVVLDGVPFAGGLGDIDPNAIKSIDILKDASATAIYGSRGANGVILITTKTGMRGAGTSANVSYNGYYGVKNAVRVDMMDGPQFNALKEHLKNNPTGGGGAFSTSALGPDETATTNTDWQDLLLRQGYVTSHDISVAGGTNMSAYSLGAGYYRDQAVIPTQSFTRYSLRANIDMEAGKWLRFGLMSNSNYNYSTGQQLGMDGALSRSPLANPYDENGGLKRVVRQIQDDAWVYTRKTIEDNKDLWRNDTRALGTFNTLYAEVKAPWVEGLKYRINLGLNYTQSHTGSFSAMGINNTNAEWRSEAAVSNRFVTNWAVENLLTYDRTFNDKHNISAVAMYSAEETLNSRSHMSGEDIPNERFQYWNVGRAEGTTTIDPDQQEYLKYGLLSYMGRVMYSYENRYMISAAIRADASSRLAPGYQWNTYPAVSVGWNIANEAFMKNTTWIDQLKLRVGYGHTSNQAIAPFSTQGTLGTTNYNFADEFVTGYLVSQLPNNKLGWEFSTTWNFGVDFGFFNNRLNGTVEYYSQKTSDVLQNVNLPITGGVASYVANVGKTENKGIEITLNGVIIDNMNGWTWEAGVNFYANRNKLVELSSGLNEDLGNMWFKGHPINSFYDFVPIGLWQEGDEFIDKYEPGATPGSIRIKYTGEFNEDGSPTRALGTSDAGDDRQIIHMDPKFQGGFNTRVAWKGLELSIVGSFQRGGVLLTSLYQGNGYLNMLNGRRGQVDVDYWTPENTDAKWPSPWALRSGDNPKYLNSLGRFDASYLKINTITLGYNLPKKWMDRAGIDGIRIYATAQNPFVFFSPFHKESGLDPEPNARGNESAYTASNSNSVPNRFLVVGTNTPNTRNYIFGVNLTF